MRAIPLVIALLVACAPMAAQQPPGAPPAVVAQGPLISASGRGEARTPPDRATIQISVQTRAPSAQRAASDNARTQQAIFDTLRTMGLAEDQLSTTGYQIFPDQRHERDREPTVVGYVVTNTLRVELRRIDMVGRVIDAAIAKGANMISSLAFHASNTDAPRQQALAAAVASARADAAAMARAAGGALGRLVELSARGAEPPIIFAEARLTAERADATPIQPGQQTITAYVTGRWEFVPR